MKVVDIYCGAGGFSEGFRQAGFDIILGIDIWEPAVLTHQSNHPEGRSLLDDVVRVSLLPDDEFHSVIPDSEVIIGSPPCVSFSNSNKSGKGDKNEGILLIKAFFRIVARKKWKDDSKLLFWIMENVPNSRNFIKESYSAGELGLNGTRKLLVKNINSKVYNAENFGVPSRRKRFFCGEFPEPEKTIHEKSEIIHLRNVLSQLGSPCDKLNEEISDPNYEFFLNGSEVTDHHYVQQLAEYQWATAKRSKQDKGYMGKMAFPEDLDRPARTILATMTFGARESMIFNNANNGFRAPTIREIASLMSFPIDYWFFGKTLGQKYRLVGNAVPPKIAHAFAKAIAKNEGIPIVDFYRRITHINKEEFYNLNGINYPIPVEKPKHANSRFKYHIPYLIIDLFRVELTNYYSDFQGANYRWDVEIHRSQGPNAKVFIPRISIGLFSHSEQKKIERFLDCVTKSLVNINNFQKYYCLPTHERNGSGLIGPYELLNLVKDFINDLENKQDDYVNIKLDEKFQKLPKDIAIGFYILNRICFVMGRLPE